MQARFVLFSVTAFLTASLAACKDSTTTPVAVISPARALVRTGDQQRLTVATVASDSLSIGVYATDGAPVVGVTVRWSVAGGNGKVGLDSSLTDASGVATTTFIAGTVAGVDQVTATIAGLDAVLFSETALPGAPARLTAMIAPEDSVMEGATLMGLGVRVVDQFGNSVPNVNITFSIVSPMDGDQLSVLTTTTNADGIALDAFSAGSEAGQRTVTVTTDSNLTVTYLLDVLAPSSE